MVVEVPPVVKDGDIMLDPGWKGTALRESLKSELFVEPDDRRDEDICELCLSPLAARSRLACSSPFFRLSSRLPSSILFMVEVIPSTCPGSRRPVGEIIAAPGLLER